MSHLDAEPDEAGVPKMPAEFGTATATFVIVASMVGVGVLTTSGFTVYFVGSNALMLGLWVVGGVIALCGALTLCELTAALPKTGGDFVYLYEAYGPVAAFLSGWVSFLIGFAAPSAVAASGAAEYLLIPLALGKSALAQRVLATALILGFAAIHVSSRRQTAWVQGTITALKIGFLVLFTIAGLAVGWSHYPHLADPIPVTRPVAVSMMFSLVYITYAYLGWNSASYLAGEVTDPQRKLPRAILLGTGGVLLLYLGLNVVYGLALSAADVHAIAHATGKENTDALKPIAQLAAQRLFGEGWSEALSVAVGLMLLSSLSAYVLTGPRVIYAMAVAGQFPAVVGRLTQRAGTPAIATALQVACALALLWTGSFESIMVFASVGLSLFSILAVGSIYVLRWKQPDLPRPFRTPGYPVTPAVFIVLTAVLTRAAFSQRPWESSYALLGILAGVPIYYGWQWLRGPSRASGVSH